MPVSLFKICISAVHIILKFQVCTWSICDNASVGSCSGGPASWCFLGSSWVPSEGRKCAFCSRRCPQVLSNTSVKVFSAPKRGLGLSQISIGGGGGARDPLLPLLRRLWSLSLPSMTKKRKEPQCSLPPASEHMKGGENNNNNNNKNNQKRTTVELR